MKQLNYRILLRKEPEGGYTVIVPSLPGCITFGDSIEEAIKMAKEAIELYNLYKDYILGVITDISFKREEKEDPDAGYKLVQHIRGESKYLPILMQSSEPENKVKVEAIGAYFLDKNSLTLIQDFHHFVLNHLGFGDFVFLLPKKKSKMKHTILQFWTLWELTDWIFSRRLSKGVFPRSC